LEYDFTLEKSGAYEVWVRIGYEFVRSPFRWKIDGGEYTTVGPDALATDLMAIADWTEVAWLKLGTAGLRAGTHTLTVNLPRSFKKETKQLDRILFGLDCICLSSEPFAPNGPHRPGSKWQSKEDVEASKRVFKLLEGKKDERSVLKLGGL